MLLRIAGLLGLAGIALAGHNLTRNRISGGASAA